MAEALTLVTVDDLTGPCGCGTPLCQMTMDEAIAHIEHVVRREIAKEMRRFAYDIEHSAASGGAAAAMVRRRAEVIRNG